MYHSRENLICCQERRMRVCHQLSDSCRRGGKQSCSAWAESDHVPTSSSSSTLRTVISPCSLGTSEPALCLSSLLSACLSSRTFLRGTFVGFLSSCCPILRVAEVSPDSLSFASIDEELTRQQEMSHEEQADGL